MNKKLFLLILILFLINITSAENLTCQYKEYMKTGEKVSVLYINHDIQEKFLKVENVKAVTSICCPWRGLYSFEVHNSLDISVNVTVTFIASGSTSQINTEVPQHNFITLGNYESLDSSSIKFIYNSNNFSNAKWEDEEVLQCRLCQGVECLNDGTSCNSSIQCGGEFCIENYCSNNEFCFDNDCNCANDKIQCSNNKQCVKITSIPLGSKPICSEKECVSGYLSLKTGNCALRNGESCNINFQCESNSCINGKCSNGTCYNNDCNCANDEVQCSDSIRCVKKDSVEIGIKPSCMAEECKPSTYCSIFNSSKCISYKYIDQTTGNCDESPKIMQLKTEESNQKKLNNLKNLILIIGFFIITILIGFFYILSKQGKQNERLKSLELVLLKEKKDVLSKEIEATIRRIEELKIATIRVKADKNKLDKIKIEIQNLDKIKEKSKDEVDKLEKLRIERYNEVDYIENKINDNIKKLTKIKQELKDNKDKGELTRKQKDKLENEFKELESQKGFYQNLKIEIAEEKLKPYKNIQGVEVHINEDGYEVFHDSGKLFHIWWYEKNNGKIRKGNHIHHINGIKTDNMIENLKEITKEEHDRLHGRLNNGNY